MEEHNHTHHHSKDKIKNVADFEIVANVFKQIGDASRVRIFWILCHYEENVTDLAELVDMTTPAVSHHLRQLKSGGLVQSRREGKEVYYKAADTVQAGLLHKMIEQVMQISCPED